MGTDLEVRQRGESDKESEAALSRRLKSVADFRSGRGARKPTCMWNWSRCEWVSQMSDSID